MKKLLVKVFVCFS